MAVKRPVKRKRPAQSPSLLVGPDKLLEAVATAASLVVEDKVGPFLVYVDESVDRALNADRNAFAAREQVDRLVKRVADLERDYDFLFGRLTSCRQVTTGALGWSKEGWLPKVTAQAPKAYGLLTSPMPEVPPAPAWYTRLWRWVRA